MIETYQVINKVRVDVNTRSEFNIEVRIKVEVEWRLRWKLSWLSMVSELRVGLRSRLISRLWSKLIFELRKYKLDYLFKYSKSMAESGSIVITVPT